MPIPDEPLPLPPAGQLQTEQEPNDEYAGKLKANLLPQNLSNLSGIQTNLNKAKAWPANWWPCPPYKGRTSWTDSSEVITFIGPWGENQFFRAYMLGWSWNAGNPDPTQPGLLLREIPHQHPEMPWLYAMEAEIVDNAGAWISNYWAKNPDGSIKQESIAFVDTSTGSDYQSCKVQVTYRRPRYMVRTDDEVYGANPPLNEMSRFLERQTSFAVDAQQLPATQAFQLYYQGGPASGQPIPQGSTRIYYNTAELTYIWHAVPDLPMAQFVMACGRINSVPFDPPQTVGGVPVGGVFLGNDVNGIGINGLPPGTVLCPLEPKYEQIDSPNGKVLWDLIVKLLVRLTPLNPDGSVATNISFSKNGSLQPGQQITWATWNHFPVTDLTNNKIKFVLGTTDKSGGGGGAPLYPSYDLNRIWTLPNPATLYEGPGVPGLIPPG